ncbi:DNA gyrase subunit A [Patescibacteria group bacterium]|nr:DNA gyrase subunit A [Patescibacteria group bacterium]
MTDSENNDNLEENEQDDLQEDQFTEDDDNSADLDDSDDTPGTLDLEEEEIFFARNLTNRPISKEMEESYLDYAMSVIVSRALPDVRDGLKPVHRRILYAMHGLGLRSSASFRKSAAVVGEVLGKFHPHGDTAVYDSMVRMAQDFSLRYMLVKGQGNFGSVDGDRAAAMRYTEAKLQKISDEMLADIDKETIDWRPNYDGKFKEPSVLPARIPQLLLNGTTGIAVGMATSIPPHNLGEIIDGTIHLANNPEATIDDLMEFIKGPDFPTSGKIYDTEAIKNTYVTGRGGITMRARAEIEERRGGKYAIVITEIPYQVNKATLVTKIAELVKDKKIVGISDIRDESNKDGMRVVIELKKEAFPKKILNQLYKYTQMQSNFNMNMIALVEGVQPRLLTLKQVLEYFLIHRKQVVRRRTEYELKIAQARAHILEGLKIALDNIDAVIETIRKSSTKEEAHKALITKFKLSDKQATAIMEMKLQTLAGLERQKIEDEYKEKMILITQLEGILADEGKILNIIIEELAEIKEKYADERRTEIIPHGLGKFSEKDTIPNEPMIVIISKEGYIKRVSPLAFKSQHRGGKGIVGATTKEEDETMAMRYANNHDNVLFFTNQGRVFQLPVYEIQKTSRTAKGQPIVNLCQLGEKEQVTSMLIIKEKFEGEHLIMATIKGTIKKTAVSEFKNVRRNGLIAIKLRDGDSLEWVREIGPNNEVIIVTQNGKCIRFKENDVRAIGRASMGVRGIKLKSDDKAVEMDVISNPQAKLFVLMENGLGKSSLVTNYRLQTRGGTGVKTAQITQKTGLIVGAKIIEPSFEGDAVLISKKGQLIRMNLKDIPSQGRATQGVYLMRLKAGDKISALSIIRMDEIEKELEESQEAKKEQVQNEVKQVENGVEKLDEADYSSDDDYNMEDNDENEETAEETPTQTSLL